MSHIKFKGWVPDWEICSEGMVVLGVFYTSHRELEGSLRFIFIARLSVNACYPGAFL